LPDDAGTKEIEAESLPEASKSDVVRRRLARRPLRALREAVDLAGDLIGSVARDGLPARPSSARKKHYLRSGAYGNNRRR